MSKLSTFNRALLGLLLASVLCAGGYYGGALKNHGHTSLSGDGGPLTNPIVNTITIRDNATIGETSSDALVVNSTAVFFNGIKFSTGTPNVGGIVSSTVAFKVDGRVWFSSSTKVVAERNSTLFLSPATWTRMVYDVETEDALGEFNGDTFTALRDGFYCFSASANFGTDASPTLYVAIAININGTRQFEIYDVASPSWNRTVAVSGLYYLKAGNTLAVDVYDGEGSSDVYAYPKANRFVVWAVP